MSNNNADIKSIVGDIDIEGPAPLAIAIRWAGGIKPLSEITDISRTTIYNWVRGKSRISKKNAKKLEDKTGGVVKASDFDNLYSSDDPRGPRVGKLCKESQIDTLAGYR